MKLLQIDFEFGLIYPNVGESTLRDFWYTISNNSDIFVMHGHQFSIAAEYSRNGQIRTAAKLLFHLPTHRKKFEKSLSSLLTISEVYLRFTQNIAKHACLNNLLLYMYFQDPNEDPMNLLGNSDSPRMIAVNSKEENEWKFYIEVKRHLISVC